MRISKHNPYTRDIRFGNDIKHWKHITRYNKIIKLFNLPLDIKQEGIYSI